MSPERAPVARAAEGGRGAKARVLFSGITAAAGADSFRARVTQGQVLGLRTEQQVRSEEFGPALKEAKEKLKALDAQREGLVQDLTRADNQARLAQELANVSSTLMSRELASGASDVRAWAQSVEAPVKALLAANNLRADTATKLRTVDAQREVWQRKIGQLQQWSRRSEWTAEVLVNCPAGKTARVELTYMVGGAHWFPSYEARADEAAGKVELSTWATVQQVTGEDWKGARIPLSTALPFPNKVLARPPFGSNSANLDRVAPPTLGNIPAASTFGPFQARWFTCDPAFAFQALSAPRPASKAASRLRVWLFTVTKEPPMYNTLVFDNRHSTAPSTTGAHADRVLDVPFNAARNACACPFTWLKLPPMNTESPLTAMARTVLLALGDHAVSALVPISIAASRSRACPPISVNSPPRYRIPLLSSKAMV